MADGVQETHPPICEHMAPPAGPVCAVKPRTQPGRTRLLLREFSSQQREAQTGGLSTQCSLMTWGMVSRVWECPGCSLDWGSEMREKHSLRH